jgi:hypothetical protein
VAAQDRAILRRDLDQCRFERGDEFRVLDRRVGSLRSRSRRRAASNLARAQRVREPRLVGQDAAQPRDEVALGNRNRPALLDREPGRSSAPSLPRSRDPARRVARAQELGSQRIERARESFDVACSQ